MKRTARSDWRYIDKSNSEFLQKACSNNSNSHQELVYTFPGIASQVIKTLSQQGYDLSPAEKKTIRQRGLRLATMLRKSPRKPSRDNIVQQEAGEDYSAFHARKAKAFVLEGHKERYKVIGDYATTHELIAMLGIIEYMRDDDFLINENQCTVMKAVFDALIEERELSSAKSGIEENPRETYQEKSFEDKSAILRDVVQSNKEKIEQYFASTDDSRLVLCNNKIVVGGELEDVPDSEWLVEQSTKAGVPYHLIVRSILMEGYGLNRNPANQNIFNHVEAAASFSQKVADQTDQIQQELRQKNNPTDQAREVVQKKPEHLYQIRLVLEELGYFPLGLLDDVAKATKKSATQIEAILDDDSFVVYDAAQERRIPKGIVYEEGVVEGFAKKSYVQAIDQKIFKGVAMVYENHLDDRKKQFGVSKKIMKLYLKILVHKGVAGKNKKMNMWFGKSEVIALLEEKAEKEKQIVLLMKMAYSYFEKIPRNISNLIYKNYNFSYQEMEELKSRSNYKTKHDRSYFQQPYHKELHKRNVVSKYDIAQIAKEYFIDVKVLYIYIGLINQMGLVEYDYGDDTRDIS